MATQTPSSDGEHPLGYVVVACPGAQSPEEGVVGSVGGGDGSGCLREVRSHMSTSRQPGASLTEQQGIQETTSTNFREFLFHALR